MTRIQDGCRENGCRGNVHIK